MKKVRCVDQECIYIRGLGEPLISSVLPDSFRIWYHSFITEMVVKDVET